MLTISRSLTGTIQYVYSGDPAIDTDSKAYNPEEYQKTLDRKHLPLKSDSDKHSIFHLRSVGMKRMQRITSMRNESGGFSTEQLGEAVAYGLKKVDDFEVEGKPFELKLETINGEERVKNESLEKMFKLLLFMELGNKILDTSDLSF